MLRRLYLAAAAAAALGLVAALCLAPLSAQDGKLTDGVKPSPSKITLVTVYQNTALVTREVTVPEAAGPMEVVVSPLPPATLESSLYAEGTADIRVLSARYRSRAIAEDNREEVRKLEAEIKTASRTVQEHEADLKAVTANAALLTKLEGFTAATMTTLTEKGQLDAEKTIKLADHVRENRAKLTKEETKLKQQVEDERAKLAFLQRQLQEKSGGVSRTERDAVIVLDKKAGAGTVKLNYLVSTATWKPQYKLRAGTKPNEPVTVEYLASVTQQTGEDWSGVNVVLSTAQPLLNAAPPDLLALEVAVGANLVASAGAGGPGLPGGMSGGGQSGFGGGGQFGMPAQSAYLRDLERQSQQLRSQAKDNLNYLNPQAGGRGGQQMAGGKQVNDAAALEQFRDLLVAKEEINKEAAAAGGLVGAGPSVTYRLKTRLTLPSRSDDQTFEIAKLELAPKFYHKAVPVLTPHVYRLADLTNTTDMILLPGEATMYLDSDFVGQTTLPLVAVGKPFTVGFGADPQLQVQRTLVDKTRTTQGGNQVLTFKYKILLSSYKPAAADVQVWDRMPHAEAAQTIATSLVKGEAELSKDPLYVRDERPKNLLRWDVKVDPKQNGEKALAVEYEFKLELDKNVVIGTLLSK
jgi:hypothetical protein